MKFKPTGTHSPQITVTPGPYVASGQSVRHIATVAYCGESTTVGVNGSESIGLEEAKCNAQFIATACTALWNAAAQLNVDPMVLARDLQDGTLLAKRLDSFYRTKKMMNKAVQRMRKNQTARRHPLAE